MTEHQEVNTLDMLIYARSMATLMGAGVSLMRQLHILAEISEEPLASATTDIAKQVEAGRTLSRAMEQWPQVFTRVYRQMVRSGEVGGVLDEALAVAADMTESDWGMGPRYKHVHTLLIPPDDDRSFEESTTDERLRILSLYCRMLGMMLAAGVPFKVEVLWQTAADIVPPGPERDALAAIPEQMEEGGSLGERFDLPFLPRFIPRLAQIGRDTGTLSQMMEKAAQLLEYQRRYHLLKQARQ